MLMHCVNVFAAVSSHWGTFLLFYQYPVFSLCIMGISIHSIVSYDLMFWGGSSKTWMERVFRHQKKALRIICGMKHSESCRGAFPAEDILTLSCMYIYSISVFVFENSHLFPLPSHSYPTRNNDLLKLPKFKHSLTCKSFMFLAPKIFNSLPNNIKCAGSSRQFKLKIRSFLSEGAYYTLDEFFDRL